jgi:drug/metabolite transporter (DMT)-like permease
MEAKDSRSENPSLAPPATAIAALLLAGFGWGATGLFVRSLGQHGLSVYELLLTRLIVTGFVIAPIFLISLRLNPRKLSPRTLGFLGLSTALYYLGAITAFHSLPLVIAALIIGSSPLIAWLLPLAFERRGPRGREKKQGVGVALALVGLLVLLAAKGRAAQRDAGGEVWVQSLGYLGAVIAALVTVVNARFLRRLGPEAPMPFEITMATVVVGLVLAPMFISSPGHTLRIVSDHVWLAIGFGILSTAIPGLAIAYASVRLAPQATATVSIQLQVWAGVLAWIVLGEELTGLQMVAAVVVITGSWICARVPN